VQATHSHTTASGRTYTIGNARVVGCALCDEDALIDRLSAYVRQWNPYKPGSVNPYRLADLLERKAGPKDYQYVHAANVRGGETFGGRVTFDVTWGGNWAFGVQVWGDRDYGFLYVDLGPLRLNLYARWGLTEDERMDRWIRQP
jgi:hypothetical protein